MTKTQQQIQVKIPKLRFPEFKNSEDWEEKKLGEITEITKGEQLNKIYLKNKGKYPAINGCILPSGFTEKWNTPLNTITISEGGNSCGYMNLLKTSFWSGGHCYSISNINKHIYLLFLYQILKYNQNKIMQLRVGSGLPNIQKKIILNYNIKIPYGKSNSKKEQQKIANCLSSLDELIESQDKKIKQLKQHKKGLMQQLFVS